MPEGTQPYRPAAPRSPSSPAPPPAPRDHVNRAQLAAALLGHDISLEPLDPSLPVHSSAVLQPFRHLLDAQAASSPSLSGSYEFVDDAPSESGDRVLPGQYAAPSDAAASPVARRSSFAGSAGWSTNGLLDTPAQPLALSPDEEERLTSEWGLDEAMSNAASDDGTGFRHRSSSILLGSAMTGVGLARVHSAGAAGEAGPPVQRGQEDDDDDAVEVLETRSMPDMDHARPLSFAESIFDGVEQRLAASVSGHASSAASPQVPVEDAASDDDDGAGGPRIKIIERTPTQRRRLGQRLRTQSLGPGAGMSSLPSLADLSGDGSVGDIETLSSGGRSGLAVRDSLFLGPASSSLSRQGSAASPRLSTTLSSSRGSADFDRATTSRPDSRLSLSIPNSRSDELPPSPTQPQASSPITSRSSPGFTSRFDPLVIAAQRAELAKARPAFANPDAGKPPQVVLLPAPLAGRPPSPPRRERVEGPDVDELEPVLDEEEETKDEDNDDDEEDFEDAPGLRKPLHPAGALYGRSLMDVMAERRAQLKAQQRAFVPGSDGRRAMFEWQSTAATTTQDEARAGSSAVEGAGDDVPLALMPAGGRARKPLRGPSPEKKRVAHASIFGPDLVYQRELARAKELEEVERAEREEVERLRSEKEDRRKSKGKLVKGAKRRSQLLLLDQAQEQGQGQERAALPDSQPQLEHEWGQEREWEPERLEEDVEELVEPRQRQDSAATALARRNSLAPSLSIPFGLDGGLSTSASGGDWFAASNPRPAAPVAGSDDEDEDAAGFRPRPISSLGGHFPAGAAARRQSAFGLSSDEDEGSDDEEDELNGVQSSPGDAGRPSPAGHLPLPGEPSSHGHGTHQDRVAEKDDGDDSEDERPLGQRFLRQSTMPDPQRAPVLNLDLGRDSQDLERIVVGDARDGSDDDEDDKPLNARFSRIQPADEDDVPLAIRRMSLAPQRFEPSARLHAVDDDGKTVSDESDDRPLGLKHAPVGASPMRSFPYPAAQPMPFVPPGYPPVAAAPGMPHSYSQFSLAPPLPAPVGFGVVPPVAPLDPHAQLALAQMQMQAALQKQATDPIERWRNEVAS